MPVSSSTSGQNQGQSLSKDEVSEYISLIKKQPTGNDLCLQEELDNLQDEMNFMR